MGNNMKGVLQLGLLSPQSSFNKTIVSQCMDKIDEAFRWA